MTVEIIPTLLQGNITAVSSKSSVHRLLIAAMLADTTTTIHLNALSEDIMATMECIRALGAKAEVSAKRLRNTSMWGKRHHLQAFVARGGGYVRWGSVLR